jgi:transcriptional regulator with XRE-family HTH domain
MASSLPSRPETKGEKAKPSKSRISRVLPKRGKYRPRKAPDKIATAGQRIRAARVALGLTQKELGERLLTDQTTVSAWEKDKSQKLAGPSLVALAELLQTTPEALLTGVGFKVPEGPIPTHKLVARVANEADIIPLPPEPPEGHLAWVEKTTPEQPHVLEGKAALAEIKKALASGRKIWLVVK